MTFHLGGGDNPPDWCFQANAQGDLPTCTYDGSWHRSYDGGGLGGGADGGIPGWFIALFVLVAVVGVLITVYKVSMARGMATRSGMDPDEATAMTLLTDNGLEATYLSANLRTPPPAAPVVPPDATPTVATRLRELKGLLDEDLITQDEYAARRQAILDQT
ncbi:SHOCT domain-containing protein [Nocardioides mangrovi]|uniref:SHOCT domain-containing protein n=1 Tax=Nocardioides mangrovi TaxID=2874580 RepID=A0ABS7U7N6_9ACTN|nr:SHOCT domain-containing protein [Nocardioides mangrovi]MBZ5736975.1 SHOCT domain-containing protein [Nocardioides mangrovi]